MRLRKHEPAPHVIVREVIHFGGSPKLWIVEQRGDVMGWVVGRKIVGIGHQRVHPLFKRMLRIRWRNKVWGLIDWWDDIGGCGKEIITRRGHQLRQGIGL